MVLETSSEDHSEGEDPTKASHQSTEAVNKEDLTAILKAVEDTGLPSMDSKDVEDLFGILSSGGPKDAPGGMKFPSLSGLPPQPTNAAPSKSHIH